MFSPSVEMSFESTTSFFSFLSFLSFFFNRSYPRFAEPLEQLDYAKLSHSWFKMCWKAFQNLVSSECSSLSFRISTLYGKQAHPLCTLSAMIYLSSFLIFCLLFMKFKIVLDWTYFLLVHRKSINISDFFAASFFHTQWTMNEEEAEHCL